MRTTRAKKPSRPIQYLLSADRTLRKLSLRRFTGRARTIKRSRSLRVRQGRQAKGSRREPVSSHIVLMLALVGIVAAATLIAGRRPSQSADPGSPYTDRDTTESGQEVAATPSNSGVQQAGTEAPSTGVRVADRPIEREPRAVIGANAAPAPAATAVSGAIASRLERVPEVKPQGTAPLSSDDSVGSMPLVDGLTAPSVTITGCVERTRDTFWLKNTSGADAPTSRSWKSGFLKRRHQSVELVDPTHELKLTDYVGQRVATTGTLSNREMRMRSLRGLATACD